MPTTITFLLDTSLTHSLEAICTRMPTIPYAMAPPPSTRTVDRLRKLLSSKKELHWRCLLAGQLCGLATVRNGPAAVDSNGGPGCVSCCHQKKNRIGDVFWPANFADWQLLGRGFKYLSAFL